MMRKSMVWGVGLLGMLLFSCAQAPPEKVPQAEVPPYVLKGDETVLARVGGTPVTEYEVDLTIRTTLRLDDPGELDAAGRKKVLESLVTARALSLLAEKELTEKGRAELRKRVAAFREELLVEKYLTDHVEREPVTPEMVKVYYEKYPEKFGMRTIRYYEMISTSRELDPVERESFIKEIGSPGTEADWGELAGSLDRSGLPVIFRKGEVLEKLFPPKLSGVMAKLPKGSASELIFVRGRPYVVRITGETVVPPRPLRDVGSTIRKLLVPEQLKKAVKKASEQAVQQVEIVYPGDA